MSRKKKLQQQRREMNQAIYQKLETEEERQDFIAKSVEGSRAKYQRRKSQEKLKKEQKANGLAFVEADLARESQDLIVFEGSIGTSIVTAGAMLVTTESGPAYQVAYSICSRHDLPSFDEGLSWVGWRIQKGEHHHHPHKFLIRMSRKGALRPKKLQALIRVHIEMDIVTERVSVPNYLRRQVVAPHATAALVHVQNLKERRVRYAAIIGEVGRI